MKKAFAFAILSSLLLFSLTAFADNAGVVGTEITITHVVNLFELEAKWPDANITQPMIEDFFANTGWMDIWDEAIHAPHSPEIRMTVQALGQFHVYAGYWTSQSAKLSSTADFLALDDAVDKGYTGGPLALAFGAQANLDTAYTGPQALGAAFADGDIIEIDPLSVVGFTDLQWSGGNNMAGGGESNEYDVLWQPQKLTGDFKAGDKFDFRIYFLVDDPVI